MRYQTLKQTNNKQTNNGNRDEIKFIYLFIYFI